MEKEKQKEKEMEMEKQKIMEMEMEMENTFSGECYRHGNRSKKARQRLTETDRYESFRHFSKK